MVFDEAMVGRRPPGEGMMSCLRMVCGPPQTLRAGERRFDCLIKVK